MHVWDSRRIIQALDEIGIDYAELLNFSSPNPVNTNLPRLRNLNKKLGLLNSQLKLAGFSTTSQHIYHAYFNIKEYLKGKRELKFINKAIKHLNNINLTFQTEAETRIFISIDQLDAQFFQERPLFGDHVERVFPIAIDDIRAAGRCLALNEATAAVFHLMRVMEAGLKGLAKELRIDYRPSWESYIKKLNEILDSKNYKSLSVQQKTKRSTYNEFLSDLIVIKNVWRNPTMHIVKSYDTKQAKSIYEAVEIFMQKLATNIKPAPLSPVSTGQIAP